MGRGSSGVSLRASALKLVSHPLFTGSDRGRWDDAGGHFDSLRFSSKAGTIRIEAVVKGTIPPYAAVAYVWPTREETDHGARTYPVVLNEGGSFSLDIDGLRPDTYHLKLAGLHANGSATTLDLSLTIDAAGRPDTAALTDWLVRRAEEALMVRSPEVQTLLSDQALSTAPTPEARASSAFSVRF